MFDMSLDRNIKTGVMITLFLRIGFKSYLGTLRPAAANTL